jgi:hypothetical protein
MTWLRAFLAGITVGGITALLGVAGVVLMAEVDRRLFQEWAA